MFGFFNRQRSVPTSSATRTPAFVEGLEGRAMMSVAPLNPGTEASLLPAVQHGFLVPAVHTTAGNAGQTNYLIGLL
jgi:hypothetical protein